MELSDWASTLPNWGSAVGFSEKARSLPTSIGKPLGEPILPRAHHTPHTNARTPAHIQRLRPQGRDPPPLNHPTTPKATPGPRQYFLGNIAPGSQHQVEMQTLRPGQLPGGCIFHLGAQLLPQPSDKLPLHPPRSGLVNIDGEGANELRPTFSLAQDVNALSDPPGDHPPAILATDRETPTLASKANPPGGALLTDPPQPPSVRAHPPGASIPRPGRSGERGPLFIATP